MRKIFLLIVSILVVTTIGLFYRFLPMEITGSYAMGNISVGVSEKLKGEITAMIFKENIDFAQIQDITIEFTNVGSVTFTEKIELKIYWNYETGKLQEVAYYYDSQAVLKPGAKRTYKVSFLPPNPGLYYIKVRIPYDSKVVEKWGAFLVTYTPPAPPTITPAPPTITPAPPTITPAVEEVGVASMSLEYPESVKILRGETKLFSILVKNTGDVSLKNLRFYISTTSLIGIEINPKQVFKLLPNGSAIFLISVTVPETTPEGKYSFDFKVISDKVKEWGNIELKVVSVLPSIKEEVYETILNYIYIISEIQHEIDSVVLRGIDVKIPQDTLNQAKISLEAAKQYYQQEKYEDAKIKLEEVRKYLEDSVFQLASASILIYLPAFAPIYIVLIAIAIGLLFLLLILLKKKREKKKEKRPKLLRAVIET